MIAIIEAILTLTCIATVGALLALAFI